MHHKLWISLLLSALLTAAPAQAAKLYKWTDEDGKVHYSEKPRNTPDQEEVIKRPPQEAQPVVVEETPIEVPVPADTTAALQAAERCQQLLHDLERYKDNKQVTDKEGNVMVISPEMREAKKSEINAELDQSCR